MNNQAKIWLSVGAVGITALLILAAANESGLETTKPTIKGDQAHTPKIVTVKYGGTVDVGHPRFEYLDTSRSSFVRGAWYDADDNYMVINLNSTYYHYCRMPSSAWSSFRRASSFGTHYNKVIKGNYDCRLGGVPKLK